MPPPPNPKIYHILHRDRLPSVLSNGFLWSDGVVQRGDFSGTTIGMSAIKRRRLLENSLNSHPGLMVGECVPFYFCPRSIMLYLLHRGNDPDLSYHGGQEPIVHLQADLQASIEWAHSEGKRWAFTLSNAGSSYFEDRSSLSDLHEINWNAVQANVWTNPEIKEGKQAEFLVEERFPWHLVEEIGVFSRGVYGQVTNLLAEHSHRPPVQIRNNWYY